MKFYYFTTFLLIPLASFIEAYYDSEKIKENKIIDHRSSMFYRVIAGLIIAMVITHHEDLKTGIVGFISFGAEYWLMFDIIINAFLLRPLLQQGKTSKIDKLIKNQYIALIIKTTLLTGAIITLIII